MSEWLGVEMWPGKRPPSRRHTLASVPVMLDQKRSEFGFTHAPGGVMRLVGDARRVMATATAVRADRDGLDASLSGPAVAVLRVLHDLADRGGDMPGISRLGELAEIKAHSVAMSTYTRYALERLANVEAIELWTGPRQPGTNELPRAVRLPDGRVLRNPFAPAVVPWRSVA